MKQLLPLLIGSSLVLAACTNTDKTTQPTADNATPLTYTPRAQNQFITQEQADYRSQRISQVSYALDFNLTGEESFNATASLNFNLKGSSHPITIDLNDAQITSLSINGNTVTADYNKWFISVPGKLLHNGNNTVEIAYQRKHSTNGEGLHRMVDPVDNKVYLYSHFEPAAAHQMFPAFDQPDLKATYEISVTAPQDWHVITAEREQKINSMGDKKRWIFGKTPKLSTYNFSLHAGPYHVWEDNSGKYPARLFARESVSSQVSPKDWFKYTKQGLAFFDNYFGIDYPFKKYDQLLVPDFLYGAMENAAAVTFSEGTFLVSGKMSEGQKEGLASTIMHEMAHQWFGNLVTMKWWNGLWLNESFAAFMASKATAEATEFDHHWRSFYARGKQRAYIADQRVTTHPIEVPVPSTANAFDNIDSITYSKGASALKQLGHLLGPDVFQQGVHNYLTKYAYKNATLDDFINSLSQTANRDLSQWKYQWLYQPGVNTITAQYECSNDKVVSFSLNQTAVKEYPVLREQRVNVGLFNLDGDGQLQLSKSMPVTYTGADTTVSGLVGGACPDLVYANYQDWGFVKVNLDAKSFATAKSAITKVSDPLLRSMLWQSLWDSVRDGLLPLNDFLDVALKNVAAEKDSTILSQVLGNIGASMNYLNRFGDSVTDYRQQVAQVAEQKAWQAIKDNTNNPVFLRIWFNVYLGAANSTEGLQRQADILAGKTIIQNLELNQSMRWSIVKNLNQFDFSGALTLIDSELERDSSDKGQKQAIAAKARRPDLALKQYWLNQFGAEKPVLNFSKLRVVMSALFPTSQNDLLEQSADQILSTLAEIDKTKGPVFMRAYARMIPSTCTELNQTRLNKAIEELKDLSAGTNRALLINHQFNQQCLNIAKNMTKH